MRGWITRFDNLTGKGEAIATDGKLYRFDIRQWSGELGPLPGKAVHLTLDGEIVVQVHRTAQQWTGLLISLAAAAATLLWLWWPL